MSCREVERNADNKRSDSWGVDLEIAGNCLSKYKNPLLVCWNSWNTRCLILLYVLLSNCHDLPNKSFQLESTVTLDGHSDSINTVKFNIDLSMLLSGGKLFVYLPALVALIVVFRQRWSYNCMELGIVWIPPKDWCLICRLRHVSLLD